MKIDCSSAAFLCALFVFLKLCGFILWPWIWVFSPFWIMILSVLFIFIAYWLTVGIDWYVRYLK